MKKFIYPFLFVGIVLLSTTGNSFGTTFVDPIDNVKEGVWFNADTLGLSIVYEDTIGNGKGLFDTRSVQISESLSGITIDIYTEFSGLETLESIFDPSSTIDVAMADFFITTTTGSYGIDLSWSVKDSVVSSEGIYAINEDTVLYSSQDIFDGYYGIPFGAFYNDSSGDQEIFVDFERKLPDFLSSITVKSTLFGYSILIDDSDTVNAMDLSRGYNFFFGTAECGNDVVYGAVPEPATLLLFGFGLLGVSAVARRKQ